MLELVDHFAGTFLIFALAILELTAIIWIYGLDNFCWDIEYMLHRKTGIYWRLSWGIITPLFMIAIFIYQMANLKDPTYGPRAFPAEYIVTGWIIFTIGAIQVIFWAKT
jgi:solute carrier family 6 amino acid transporter-like protein 5/7/9/14